MDKLPVKKDEGLLKTYNETYWKVGKHDRSILQAGVIQTIGKTEGKALEEGIRGLLQFIKKDIGLKKEISDYDFSRFMTYVRTYYDDMSLPEIRLAFEYAMVGLLNEYLPKRIDGTVDIRHYQEFSADYYTKILNAYREKKNKVWQKAMKIEQDAWLDDKVEMTEKEKQEYHQQHIQGIIDMFDNYKKRRKINTMFPFLVIDDFIRWGLLDGKRKYTDEHYQMAKDNYEETGTVSRWLARSGYRADKISKEAQRICDVETIQIVFEKIINRGHDIRDYVK